MIVSAQINRSGHDAGRFVISVTARERRPGHEVDKQWHGTLHAFPSETGNYAALCILRDVIDELAAEIARGG